MVTLRAVFPFVLLSIKKTHFSILLFSFETLGDGHKFGKQSFASVESAEKDPRKFVLIIDVTIARLLSLISKRWIVLHPI